MEQTNLKILEFCEEIGRLYDDHKDFLMLNCSKINQSSKLKNQCFYSSIIFGYGKEISTLQQLNWNTSVEALGRDLLEGYSIFKRFTEFFSDNQKSKGYFEYLVAIDLEQDKKIFNAIKSDSTYQDEQRRTQEMIMHLTRFENVIRQYFPEDAVHINHQELESSLINTINSIYKRMKLLYHLEKHEAVSRALKANNEWKRDSGGSHYEGADVIYRALCHSTHQSISSVEDRLIHDGNVILNYPSKNILGLLSLVFYCLKDSLSDLKKSVADI